MSILKKLETDSLVRKKIIILTLVTITLVAILEIWSVNRLSTYGEEINKLEKTRLALNLENQLIQNEIAKYSALIEIEDYAKFLGFERIHNLEYFKPLDLAAKSLQAL